MSAWGPPSTSPASPAASSIEITSRTGAVVVTAVDGAGVAITKGRAEIDERGVVHAGTQTVELVCPPGTHVTVASRTGSITCRGALGRVFASSRTGRVEIESAAGVDVRSRTGAVHVGQCAGRCTVVSATGRVSVAAASEARITTSTGKVHVGGTVDAAVSTSTGSVAIHARGTGTVHVRSVSGTVTVAVDGDANPATTLRTASGSLRGPAGRRGPQRGAIVVETVSGDIEVG